MKISTILVLVLLISTGNSCMKNSNDKRQFNIPKEYKYLLKKVENLRISMINYMEDANPDYTEKDVNKCVEILHKYIQDLAKTNSKSNGMEIVKSTILDLNQLNENCNGQLIETSEREQIAEIITLAGNEKGYNSKEEDITEEWREW